MTTLGASLHRVDGVAKVTGRAAYSSDVRLPGMVHAALVTSTLAAGRVALLDTTAAEQAPGVLGVLSHLNAPRLQPLGFVQPGQSAAAAGHGFRPLQDDRVRYAGQPLALVVAETELQARQAATRVTVSYDPEPHQVDFGAALGGRFKPEAGGFGEDVDYSRGAVKHGLAQAEVSIDAVYDTAPVHHNPLGTFAAVALWEGQGLTIHDVSQGVFTERKVLAGWLGLDPQQVRVLSPYAGGAFGSALRTNPHSVLAALAARLVGRPVRLALTRAQQYTLAGHRPQSRHALTLGATRDGRFTALRHDVVHSTSAFDEHVDPNTEVTRMLYACPHLGASTRLVRLNIDTPCPMRAPSQANGVFALESAVDELAHVLALDPLELRLRNHADSDPDSGLPWSSKSLVECYRRGAQLSDWSRRPVAPRSLREGRWLLGLGMASTTYPVHHSPAAARVRIDAGGVLVQSGSTDIGPGTYTAMTQVAAAALGVAPERVRFELGDSAMPRAPLQGGSMTAVSVGTAVYEACRRARRELLGDGDDGEALTAARLSEALQTLGQSSLETQARTQGGSPQGYSAHAFGAHFVRVRVDSASGEVRVDRYVGVFGAGRIINPATARSQIIGGLSMGLGQALMEQTLFDRTGGRIVNADLEGYPLPVCADIPRPEVVFLDEQDPHLGPLGAKGIGELAIIGVAPAIANAVFHATGVRVRSLPILPEKLLEGL